MSSTSGTSSATSGAFARGGPSGAAGQATGPRPIGAGASGLLDGAALFPTDAPPRRAPGQHFVRVGEGPAEGPLSRLQLREEVYAGDDREGATVAEDPAGPWRPLRDEPWMADLVALREGDRRGVKHAVREAPKPEAAPAPVVVPPPPPDRSRLVMIGVAALALGVIGLTVAWVLAST